MGSLASDRYGNTSSSYARVKQACPCWLFTCLGQAQSHRGTFRLRTLPCADFGTYGRSMAACRVCSVQSNHGRMWACSSNVRVPGPVHPFFPTDGKDLTAVLQVFKSSYWYGWYNGWRRDVGSKSSEMAIDRRQLGVGCPHFVGLMVFSGATYHPRFGDV